MTGTTKATARIRRLVDDDPLACRLLIASLVTHILKPEGYLPVVVGGTAVDTYVAGGFGTSEKLPAGWEESLDIDTITMHIKSSLEKEPRNLLEANGFKSSRPGGGSLRLKDIPYAVDFVGDWFPDDYSQDHATIVHLEDAEDLGLEPPRLTGPEDILFDYMESGWDIRHPRDWARALAVAAVMEDHLDLGYLFTKAHWRGDGAFVEPLERMLRGEPLQPHEPSPPGPV